MHIQDGATPHIKGTYVCYVNGPIPDVGERVFLVWDGERWSYPFSDQRYRNPIYGFIGPLPVMRLK